MIKPATAPIGRAAEDPASGPADDMTAAPAEPGASASSPALLWLGEAPPARADLRARTIAGRKKLFAPQGNDAKDQRNDAGGSARAFFHWLALTRGTVDDALAALPEDASQEEWNAAERRALAEARRRHPRAEFMVPDAGPPAEASIFPDVGAAQDSGDEPSLADLLQLLGPRVPRTAQQRRQDIRDRAAARKLARGAG